MDYQKSCDYCGRRKWDSEFRSTALGKTVKTCKQCALEKNRISRYLKHDYLPKNKIKDSV